MAWRLAGSLVTLRAQINAEWPARSRRSDGTIGDSSHAARASDHNPNAQGVVTAFDCTHDPASGADMHLVAEDLRESRDPRLEYVIFYGRMFASYRTAARAPWTWGPYTGSNPHTSHMHVSVTGLYDRTDEWQIGGAVAQFTDEEAEFLRSFAQEGRRLGTNGKDFAYWLLKLFRNIRDTFRDN